ncbi:hypothetical protein V2J09_021015 [Rumex salicifolius]
MIDYVAWELSRKPFSVILLENVDKIDDPLSQRSLSQDMKVSRFTWKRNQHKYIELESDDDNNYSMFGSRGLARPSPHMLYIHSGFSAADRRITWHRGSRASSRVVVSAGSSSEGKVKIGNKFIVLGINFHQAVPRVSDKRRLKKENLGRFLSLTKVTIEIPNFSNLEGRIIQAVDHERWIVGELMIFSRLEACQRTSEESYGEIFSPGNDHLTFGLLCLRDFLAGRSYKGGRCEFSCDVLEAVLVWQQIKVKKVSLEEWMAWFATGRNQKSIRSQGQTPMKSGDRSGEERRRIGDWYGGVKVEPHPLIN